MKKNNKNKKGKGISDILKGAYYIGSKIIDPFN
jgi:hypothetical protein